MANHRAEMFRIFPLTTFLPTLKSPQVNDNLLRLLPRIVICHSNRWATVRPNNKATKQPPIHPSSQIQLLKLYHREICLGALSRILTFKKLTCLLPFEQTLKENDLRCE